MHSLEELIPIFVILLFSIHYIHNIFDNDYIDQINQL